MKHYILSLLLFVTAHFSFSQYEGYEWGDDIVTAKGKYNVLRTETNSTNYEAAIPALNWLLKNTPNLHVNLYKYAARVYEGLEKKEEDPARKIQLQDSALWVYDTRIKYFGEEATVLNYKGKVAWKYLKKRDGTHKELYALYSKIFELNGDSIFTINALAHMYLSCKEYKKKGLSRDELKQLYFTLMDILDQQAANEPKRAKIIHKNADQIERKFLATSKLDCEEIVEIFGKKFNEAPDVAKAKRLKNMLTKKDCKEADMYIDAVKYIEKFEPSAGGSMSIASIYKKTDQIDSAIVYYKKAEALSTMPAQQSNIYMELAKLYSKKSLRAKAREYAQKAIATGHNIAIAYTFIGDLYFNSFAICKGGNVLEERALFIAAYDMYEKGGNTSKMAMAKEQFPSAEDIFTYNKEVGDEFQVGCWINVTVRLQKR